MFKRNCSIYCLAFILTLLGVVNSLSADIFDDYCYEQDDDYIELNYTKIGGGFINVGQDGAFLPIVSIGRRYECPDYAIDYSINAGYAKGIAGNSHSIIYYSLPKILCLSFTDPNSSSSFYWGGGASWTGIINNNARQIFHGVSAEAAFGFELQRTCQMRSFIQLDVTQPVLPAYRKGDFPTPTFLLTFGLAY